MSSELSQQHHRAFAHFTAMQCWISGYEGVSLTKEDLYWCLDLSKIKAVRILDLIEDITTYFPYHMIVCTDDGFVSNLILSRSPVKDWDGVQMSSLDEFLFTHKFSKLENNIMDFNFKMFPRYRNDETNNDIYKSLFGDHPKYARFLALFSQLLVQGKISPEDINGFKIAKITEDDT